VLGYALYKQQAEVVRCLLTKHAVDPTETFCDTAWSGWTPIGYAISLNNEDLVAALVPFLPPKALKEPLNPSLAEGCSVRWHQRGNKPLTLVDFAGACNASPSIVAMMQGQRCMCCRAAVVALLGTRRFRHTVLNSNPLDVVRIVASFVWATRHEEIWEKAVAQYTRHLQSTVSRCNTM